VSAYADTAFSTTAFDPAAFDFGIADVAAESTAQTPAGGNRRKQRYYVEVDGQSFPVDSRAQAEAILQRAKGLAEKDAEQQSEAVVKKLSKKASIPVVEIPAPTVKVSPELELAPLIAEIEQLYVKAAANAELRLRMALVIAQREQEDEDELLLLL
jgi:hypothetical protein